MVESYKKKLLRSAKLNIVLPIGELGFSRNMHRNPMMVEEEMEPM
jgi:hypothetical protein